MILFPSINMSVLKFSSDMEFLLALMMSLAKEHKCSMEMQLGTALLSIITSLKPKVLVMLMNL